MEIDPKMSRKKDMAKLRKKMDGDDRFFDSHQIKKVRTREREIPDWALNDKEVQKILLRAFPGLLKKKDKKARKKLVARAGRWVRLIHLYYRVQMSNSQVAKEIGEPLETIKSTIRSIRRVAAGRRANNGASRGLVPVGRPKVKEVPPTLLPM